MMKKLIETILHENSLVLHAIDMDAIILALLEGKNRHHDLLKRHANME